MKKVVISTLAVLMACPAFARGTGESSWQLFGLDPYIGIRGGFSYNNLNVSHNEKKESLTDWIWQGRAAMGLELCRRVRSEIEWSIFSKAKDTKSFNLPESIKVETKMQTLLWNNFMEFGDWRIVRPFAGVGVGVAFPNIKQTGELYDKSFAKMRFSAMGSLGVSFDMEYFAVDVAARYNYVDVMSGMHNFGADLGIRFMF